LGGALVQPPDHTLNFENVTEIKMVHLAIVGVGRWGRVLVDAVQGRSDTVRFTRAVARTPAKAQAFCQQHGLALDDDLQSALQDPAIDGVVLATPHSQHEAQIIAAATHGKHVFCEKPVTLTRASCERAMAAVAQAGVVFAAGHNRRFLPAIEQLKTMVSEGTLGTILHVEGNMSGHVGNRYTPDMWRVDPSESPAGGMAGSGIHVIDAMIHLCGPISEVEAQSLRIVNTIAMDDTTSALFRFARGASGYLVAMMATAPMFRIQVFGSLGWAELRGETALEFQPVEGVRQTWTFPPVSTELRQIEAFAQAIATGTAYPIATGDVINGVAAFEAVAASAASRARIAL
jgi:predicted dehydrogenase